MGNFSSFSFEALIKINSSKYLKNSFETRVLFRLIKQHSQFICHGASKRKEMTSLRRRSRYFKYGPFCILQQCVCRISHSLIKLFIIQSQFLRHYHIHVTENGCRRKKMKYDIQPRLSTRTGVKKFTMLVHSYMLRLSDLKAYFGSKHLTPWP